MKFYRAIFCIVAPRFLAPLFLVFVVACGGSNSPTAPTSTAPPAPAPAPAPAPPPAITRVTLVGVVTNANTGAAIGSVTVTASNANTSNASSVTDGNGFYSIPGVAVGTVALNYVSPAYLNFADSVTVSGDTRRDVRLTPLFTRTGIGNTVFDMPTTVSRLRIIGTYTGNSSNFIVRVGGRLVVNEIIGTSQTFGGRTRSEGLYLVTGGVVEITNSAQVVWEFSQEK